MSVYFFKWPDFIQVKNAIIGLNEFNMTELTQLHLIKSMTESIDMTQ